MVAPVKVRKLAAELVAQGVESQYLSRVLARVDPEGQLESVQAEIAREVAQALGRTEDRLNLALAELELLKARYEDAVRSGAPASEREQLAAAFNAQRTVAQARLRDMLIHREACGFRRNAVLNELYPIPPKLRAGAG